MITNISEIYRRALRDTLAFAETRSGNFFTYIARPKFADTIENTSADLSYRKNFNTAIMISGNVVYEDHFTRDTIRLYQKYYPEVLIILSVRDNEDMEYLEDMRNEKTKIITSGSPAKSGRNNNEWKRIAHRNGIHEAKQQGCKYILRSRPDHRLYSPHAVSLCLGIINTFSIPDTSIQKKRLIICGAGSNKHIPYSLSPMFMFGDADDMLAYWSYNSIPNFLITDNHTNHSSPQETSIEAYLTLEFLKAVGIAADPHDQSQSNKLLAERFCVVDPEMLDLYWHFPQVSDQHVEEHRSALYKQKEKIPITFAEWLFSQAHNMRTCNASV